MPGGWAGPASAGIIAAVATAQDSFKAMLREEIGPALRELGFKGSGQRFELPSDRYWALIGFQRSAWSDSAEVRFTINVTVASRSGWAEARSTRPFLGERPAPNAIYSAPTIAMQDYVWQSRIGRLLPAGTDRWWQVSAGMDARPVAAEVIGVIRDYALPAMRLQMGES